MPQLARVGARDAECDAQGIVSSGGIEAACRERVTFIALRGDAQHRITKTIRLKLNTVNDIVAQHFADSPSKAPNLVSLDVEGLDYAILQSFDFAAYRPEVFCLETLTFAEDKSERKLTEIIELMHGCGYMAYADTYINTIFVDATAWQKRP